MVSFWFYYYNVRSSHVIYLLTLLALSSYYPFTSFLTLSLLDFVIGLLHWHKAHRIQSSLQFIIHFEHKRESTDYKRRTIIAYVGVLLPYIIAWVFSVGKDCIGTSTLAYVLMVCALTYRRILVYDGPVHEGLEEGRAPDVPLLVSSLETTDFILSNLYTMTYLIHEELTEGHNVDVVAYTKDAKYSHLPWHLMKHFNQEHIALLRGYLLLSHLDEHKKHI